MKFSEKDEGPANKKNSAFQGTEVENNNLRKAIDDKATSYWRRQLLKQKVKEKLNTNKKILDDKEHREFVLQLIKKFKPTIDEMVKNDWPKSRFRMSRLTYIFEEFAVLIGCCSEELAFPKPKQTKSPLYFIYPRPEDTAFTEVKKVFMKQNLNPQFDVKILSTHLSKDQNDQDLAPTGYETIEENAVSEGLTDALQADQNTHYSAEFDNPDRAKELLLKEDKYLLFLISVGQDYHEGNQGAVTVGLIENLILGCKDLKEKLIKGKDPKELEKITKGDPFKRANGKWHIKVIIGDTLQAYNQESNSKEEK
ncbi:MAG: hypothetical protein ACHQ1D_07695, partial [Nitrososphaerales archaeon]